MEFRALSDAGPQAPPKVEESAPEVRRHRFFMILLVGGLQCWLAVAVFVLLRTWVGDGAASNNEMWSIRSAPQCETEQSSRQTCTLRPEHLLLPHIESSDYVLVQSATRQPCAFSLEAAARNQLPLAQAIEKIEHACGLTYLGQPEDPTQLCDLLEQEPCSLFFVAGEHLLPCASVVAGPLESNGNPRKASTARPLITVAPGITFSDALLRLFHAKSLARGSKRAPDNFAGSAFSGWLVLPLLSLGEADVHRVMAIMGRMAGAVAQPSRPDPVLVDLAGLKSCPSKEQLVETMRVVHTLGLKPVGYIPAGTPQQQLVLLKHEAQIQARFMSFRVLSEARSDCPTLPTFSTAGIIDQVEAALATLAVDKTPLAVVLHWPHAGISERSKQDTLRTILDMGAFLAVGLDTSTPRTVLTGRGGLGVVSLGAYLDERVLASSTGASSGVMVQCAQQGLSAPGCTVTPIAHSLGEPVPVPNRNCSTCPLLPSHFFERLWDTRSCESE